MVHGLETVAGQDEKDYNSRGRDYGNFFLAEKCSENKFRNS